MPGRLRPSSAALFALWFHTVERRRNLFHEAKRETLIAGCDGDSDSQLSIVQAQRINLYRNRSRNNVPFPFFEYHARRFINRVGLHRVTAPDEKLPKLARLHPVCDYLILEEGEFVWGERHRAPRRLRRLSSALSHSATHSRLHEWRTPYWQLFFGGRVRRMR